jgi:hypothetical protein
MSKPPKDAPKTQHQRFVETARQLECDEDQERFEKKLGQIVKVKAQKKPAVDRP